MREGPRIEKTCYGCKHYQQERYNVQGDVGYDRYCAHPSHGERKSMGDPIKAITPAWCPCPVPTDD